MDRRRPCLQEGRELTVCSIIGIHSVTLEKTGGWEEIEDVCSPEGDMLNGLADAVDNLEDQLHAALIVDEDLPGAAWHGGRLDVAVPGGSVMVVEGRDVRA